MHEYSPVNLVDSDYLGQNFETQETSVNGLAKEKKFATSKIFTRDEDCLLAAAFLNTMKDAVAGNNQQSSTFWGRICKFIGDNGTSSSSRTQSAIKTCWRDINKICTKFVGCLSQIEQMHQSKHTKEDRVIH